MRSRIYCGLYTAVIVVVSSTSFAGAADLDKLVSNVVKADDLGEYDEQRLKLLSKLSTNEVRDLKGHHHDTIALLAAWHEVKETFGESTMPETLTKDGDRIDQLKLERFLGFVEGRLRIRAPKVWIESFRKLRVFADREANLWDFSVWPVQGTKIGVHAPLNVRVFRSEDQMRICTPDGACTLPGTWRPDKEPLSIGIAAAIDDKYCVYTSYGRFGWRHEIRCHDHVKNCNAWKSTVFSGYYGGISGGGLERYDGREEIRIIRDRVFVFGACFTGPYVEVFSLKSGAPLCRFTVATQW